MKKIPSFTVNHLDLLPGIYISRVDEVGDCPLTTYDIRMKAPNKEPVLHTAEIHTLEHLGATFLRNHPIYGSETIYFGPMGCRTGFYLILKGNASSEAIVPLMQELFSFMATYTGDIPGASARDCGNFLDLNLPMARFEAKQFLEKTLLQLTPEHLNYPSL